MSRQMYVDERCRGICQHINQPNKVEINRYLIVWIPNTVLCSLKHIKEINIRWVFAPSKSFKSKT